MTGPTVTTEAERWYQRALIYQLHVRAFSDSNGDGIGDFRGLTSRLDYIQELGVTAVWLLPFYPSPLRDDGYDIADYHNIHPDYGTMRDFDTFLKAAHDRGLRVITEVVINHTSDQHAWFQRARRAAPDTSERDFYVWSDTPDRYTEARIIFRDTETSNWAWDPVARAYYWHRFFAHQPDLNFESPDVKQGVFEAVDFWLERGVDGLRLDAVPYLYERDGTMCENLPETHVFLKELRAHVDARFSDRMLLAEANQWPEDAVAYFGDGDECHMCFHFPLMPRLFMAMRMENRFPVIDIVEQTPAIPDTSAWAIFLRNHDELTLEMVTDEERDYMYRVYARDPQARINLGIRRRLGPLLGNDRRQVELMNALLFSLPGTPVIYYGDEIGMGDNIYLGDRNGVRTPMQWSGDRNAGFSMTNPQRLFLPVITDPEYHFTALNVEAQHANPSSLWWWMKRMIAQRKALPALSRGSLTFLHPDNPKVLAYELVDDEEAVLVVANLSRHVQAVELDLGRHQGVQPVEVFGRTDFPAVGELPYFLTLGPYQFYWFRLQRADDHEALGAGPPRIWLPGEVTDDAVFQARSQLQGALSTDLPRRRWFRSKAQSIAQVEIVDVLALPDSRARLMIMRVDYLEQETETYVFPLAVVDGEEAEWAREHGPASVVALVSGHDGMAAALVDAAGDPTLGRALLDLVRRNRRLRGAKVELRGSGRIPRRSDLGASVTIIGTEQSNTSIVFDERLILKLFRKLESGENPDIEISRYLTDQAGFQHVPAVRGVISVDVENESGFLGLLQEYVPNQGDAWSHTVDALGRFVDELVARSEFHEARTDPGPPGHPLDLVREEPPRLLADLAGLTFGEAELLGRRTGELHCSLRAATGDPAFEPEPMTTLYQRSLYQGMRALVRQNLALLRRQRRFLAEDVAIRAGEVLEQEQELLERLRRISEGKISAIRTRIHGDYHLGQVLYTGNDFVIIDFEGEPQRPLSERRIKRSPLRDVAAMIRSYHYAAHAGLAERVEEGVVARDPEAIASVEPWTDAWFRWSAASFVGGYLEATAGAGVVPQDEGHMRILLDSYLLEKAVYELGYELNNRPDWVGIPLSGILLHLG